MRRPLALVGRQKEERELRAALDRGQPLLTLVGPGGVGKTALVRAVLGSEPSVIFVALDDTRDLDELSRRILVGLGADADVSRGALARALASAGPITLVLDNVEQLMPSIAPLIARWLDAAPELTIIVTSREPLRLSIETVLEVEPLSGDDAVELLRRTAETAGHTVTDAELPVARRVAAQLGGLPLAIKLVAARARGRPLPMIAESLAAGGLVDDEGAIDLPERHRTVSSAVKWSTDLLDEPLRRAFAAAGICRGEINAEDLAALLNISVDDATRRASALADRSLWIATPHGWDVLAPIRSVAAKMARSSRDRKTMNERHAQRFVDEAMKGRVKTAELRAIIRRAREFPAFTEVALRAASFLDRQPADDDPTRPIVPDLATGPAPSAAADIEETVRMLVESSAVPPTVIAPAAVWLAERAWSRGKHDVAAGDAKRALAVATDAATRASAELILARAQFGLGENAQALETAQRAVDGARALGDKVQLARALQLLGSVHQTRHESGDAEQALLAARDLARETHALAVEAHVEASLGMVALDAARVDEARERLARARELAKQAGDARTVEVSTAYAGLAAFEAGTVDAAVLLDEALAAAERSQNALHKGVIAAYLAMARAKDDHVDDAGRLIAVATAELANKKPWGTVAKLCGGHVHLARARAAKRRGDDVDASRERELAERALGETQAELKDSDDARIVHRSLQRALAQNDDAPIKPARTPRLRVGPAAAWFIVDDGERVDLSRRRLLRTLFMALIKQRTEKPDEPMTLTQLVRAGWPDEERIAIEVHKNRLHVALSSLRSLGLRDVLVYDASGYRLAADLIT